MAIYIADESTRREPMAARAVAHATLLDMIDAPTNDEVCATPGEVNAPPDRAGATPEASDARPDHVGSMPTEAFGGPPTAASDAMLLDVLDAMPLDAVDASVLADLEEMQEEGEPNLVAELIGLYLGDAPRKLASMREAVAGGDAALLRRAAHSLKGSSASLGAFGVAALCGELERACGEDSSGRAATLVARLGQEMERARLVFEDERRKRSRGLSYLPA
ncbi:MAG: Hpt domain-containing protein [Acidobacteriota bacterium]|nr:Hpt domain-containing protein [Acidobacteriota bacterium]MDQ5836551.1 Hpt domain-containing protein [Acidobacteriota bacterium]